MSLSSVSALSSPSLISATAAYVMLSRIGTYPATRTAWPVAWLETLEKTENILFSNL
jgi:hypothetical protein